MDHTPTTSSSSLERVQQAELKRLLEENLRYSQLLYQDMARVRRFMFWRMIFGILSFLLILTPLVLAVLYLPPFLDRLYEDYQILIGGGRNPLEFWSSIQQ